jgi:hypothetical protein
VLQTTCQVSASTRGGANTLTVFVGSKGRAAMPGGAVTRHVDTLTASAASPAVISAIGALPVTITGRGFDSTICSRNRVAIGGVPCLVTSCTEETLVATFPGQNDVDTAYINLDTNTTLVSSMLVVTVLGTDGATLQTKSFTGLIQVATGGNTVPYCVLAPEATVAVLGAATAIRFRCSKAAVRIGVVTLHAVTAEAAGLSASAGGRRRLAEQPSTLPQLAENMMPAGGSSDPIVCKVC